MRDGQPLLVRMSGSDWVEGGLDAEAVGAVAASLKERGVDLIDVSSGGISPEQQIPVGPGYQVNLAGEVRRISGLPVSAVGLITEPAQAETILRDGSADAVMLARALLRNPSWPQQAAYELGAEVYWPPQYVRARLR
jgi:2,4-dienoyl-CoA reductase-like NADH-dependent reductase (Old Yellow Enzyme family)